MCQPEPLYLVKMSFKIEGLFFTFVRAEDSADTISEAKFKALAGVVLETRLRRCAL